MTTGMDLEGIALSEVSQMEKDEYHMISLKCGIKWKLKKKKNNIHIDTENRLVVTRRQGSLGVGEMGEAGSIIWW